MNPSYSLCAWGWAWRRLGLTYVDPGDLLSRLQPAPPGLDPFSPVTPTRALPRSLRRPVEAPDSRSRAGANENATRYVKLFLASAERSVGKDGGEKVRLN